MIKFNIKDYKINKDHLSPILIRKGIFYILFVSGLAISILFILPIQEKMEGEARIYRSGIPARIKAPSQGKLYLNVKSFEQVNEGDLIGTIGWDLTEDDLNILEELADYKIDYQNTFSINRLIKLLERVKEIKVKDLHSYISAVENSITQYKLLRSTNDPNLMLESISKEITQKYRTLNEVEASKTPLSTTKSITKNQMAADKLLYEDGVISQRDFEASKTKLAEVDQRLTDINVQQERIKQDILSLESNQTGLQSKYKSLLSSYQLKIFDKLEEFESYYRSQLDKRLLWASISGKIEIEPYTTRQVEIGNNQDILKIVPQKSGDENRMFVLAPTKNIGEVKPGQKVFIELQEYSASDYGFLEARVINKSQIPYNEKYIVDIDLIKDLKTSLNIELPEQSYYKGKADIMLKKTSIAKSIWNEVYLSHRKLRR